MDVRTISEQGYGFSGIQLWCLGYLADRYGVQVTRTERKPTMYLLQDNASAIGKILAAAPIVGCVVYGMIRLAGIVHGIA